MVIRSFRSVGVEDIFNGADTTRARKACPALLWQVARRKLELLDSAGALNDLRSPPANRLEALKGVRAGQHSIRVNRQYRICFVWTDGGPAHVQIVDYHS
ncbi:MAG: type II toxin-antitoxin system RelE/ParE family toxin [Gemmatimonadaceae bacterium]|nr:type II toxin-antitoxin system RelE/ParE family toxin [Gemmatimonadaceae bacterium]